jgi:hypothetical protein
MRPATLSLSALTITLLCAAGCTQTNTSVDQPTEAGGKADSTAPAMSLPYEVISDQCSAGCGTSGCLAFCHEKTVFYDAYCTLECVPYDTECTQECGTPSAPGPYLFCKGQDKKCNPMEQGDCSSYVESMDDPANCGMCNTNCDSCDRMQCTCKGKSGVANLFIDNENCGACGNVCAAGSKCKLAKCYTQAEWPD